MSRQVHKGKIVVQTTSSREEHIRMLMGAESTHFYGRHIPRWEAEQLSVPVGTPLGQLTESELWRKRQLRRRKELSNEFHGRGTVGQAFQELCNAGCDEKWLERALLSSGDYFPFGRSRRVYSHKDKKGVEHAISNLESAAADLTQFISRTDTLFMHSTAVEDWPVPLLRIPPFLRGIAYCLRECLADTHLPNFQGLNASFRLPYLINEVKRRTAGHRPHYEQMATLIGAAYRKPNFSANDLKMLVSRSPHFGRRQSM
jgi:hypothetical protein